MSFGEKVLEKYGWKKGEGLGKLKDGMKEAIKPKLKANNLGLGFKLGAEFQDNWWENVYNAAASNINVESEEKLTPGITTVDDNVEYLPHKKKKNRKSIKEEYSIFQKKKEGETSDNEIEEVNDNGDIDLFKKCGGRTVHKGARHGLNLSGKLERLEKHEKEILHSIKGNEFKKKKKKKKKDK